MRIARVRIWIGVVSALLAAHGGAPLSAQFAAPPDRDNTLFEEATQQLGCFASTSNGAPQNLFVSPTQELVDTLSDMLGAKNVVLK